MPAKSAGRSVERAIRSYALQSLASKPDRLRASHCLLRLIQGTTTMIVDLTGKHAIVTGSTSGIGFAIARGLAESGAAVVINGRSQKSVDAALLRLAQQLPQAKSEGIAADLATATGAAAFVERASRTDILVNNLGIFEPKPFDAITDEDWQRFFEINVMSGVRLSRHYLPSMVGRGWGRIVFISSESALNIPVEMIHYGMTKTAQLAVSPNPSPAAA